MTKNFPLLSILIIFHLLRIDNIFAFTHQDKVIVTAFKIKEYDFYEKFTTVGQCKSDKSRSFYSKVNGTVDFISNTQGQNVNSGDVLIAIDREIAEATKSRAIASFESAKSTYNRNFSLLEKNVSSQDLLNKSKVNFETAKTELTNAINNYNDMIIKAPFDGYIGVAPLRVGDDVKVGDYLFSFISGGEKIVFIELPEAMYKKINDSSEVYVSDLNKKQIQGKILAVSNYLNDNGTMTSKLSFPKITNIIHGSYVDINIIFNKHKGIGIAERAIIKNNEGNFIYKN